MFYVLNDIGHLNEFQKISLCIMIDHTEEIDFVFLVSISALLHSYFLTKSLPDEYLSSLTSDYNVFAKFLYTHPNISYNNSMSQKK